MERKDLLAALKRVSPAIGRGDLLPQLAHLWFDGANVSAFDDTISISTPCPIALEGGVNGTTLLTTVDRSNVRDFELKTTASAATFKLGARINLKLPVMPLDQRQFVMPSPSAKAVIDVDRQQFNAALKFCLQSVGHDVSHPEWSGITFEVVGSDLHIYSGYSQVLVQAVVPLGTKPTKFKRTILHEKFCAQVLAYPDAALELHDDHGLLDQKGVIRVFGRSLSSDGALALGDMVKVALERAKGFVQMPALENMLNRAMQFEGDHLNLHVAVVDGKQGKRIKMISNSGAGELVDYSKPLVDEHEEIEVATNARHLRNGAAALSDICIGSDEIVMRGGDIIQVVSVASPR
jgi:hypothetical protein